jgi:hypothetical protein
MQGCHRVFDISQEIPEGDRVEGLFREGETIGHCSNSTSSGVVREHLLAEIYRHHPMAAGFEQSADGSGSGGDIEDQTAGSE